MNAKQVLIDIRNLNSQIDVEFEEHEYSDRYNTLERQRNDLLRDLDDESDIENLSTVELLELVSYFSSYRPVEPFKALLLFSSIYDKVR